MIPRAKTISLRLRPGGPLSMLRRQAHRGALARGWSVDGPYHQRTPVTFFVPYRLAACRSRAWQSAR
jgi:hypothetical protein